MNNIFQAKTFQITKFYMVYIHTLAESLCPRRHKTERPQLIRTAQLEENVLNDISNRPEKTLEIELAI